MKRFAAMVSAVDSTTRTSEKVAAIASYLAEAPAADAAWAVHFLSGGRPKRLIPVRRLASWAMEASDVPEWLFEESYDAVGDLAEAIALLLPAADATSERPLASWVEDRILALGTLEETAQHDLVLQSWRELDGMERFVFNKLITGGFRVGVSQSLVIRAVARMAQLPEATIAHRLAGTWLPRAESFESLVAHISTDEDISRPYPFFLAYALEDELEALGDATEWQAEWKWDGIRSQLVRRAGRVYLWSRGEELVTERFPELEALGRSLADGTVIDGEIMPWREGPLPFAQLQRRIGRTSLGPKILRDVPVVILAYDLLELGGADLRERPLAERRAALSQVTADAADTRLILSPQIPHATWDDIRAAHRAARDQNAEGLMLKRLDSPYGVGRRRGTWWKWKVAPFTVDAVMVYAQAGHGRRASLHTDYTFAIWKDDALVPFAKAYSGLTDAEIRQVDAWVRRNTTEKFGPVRAVKAEQVFELAFEGIQRSTRHKSGIAVRFPRILRWRTDKRADEADRIEMLHAMMDAANAPRPGSGITTSADATPLELTAEPDGSGTAE